MPWSYVSKHHFGPPGAWLVYEQYSTPAKADRRPSTQYREATEVAGVFVEAMQT
jgi:hypothetical protein